MANDFKFSINTLNFDDIVTQLKDYYASLGYEYVETSNFKILLKLLSFFSMLNGQYISNEVLNKYLDSANVLEAIYAISKQIGYTPRRRIPSKSKSTSNICSYRF